MWLVKGWYHPVDKKSDGLLFCLTFELVYYNGGFSDSFGNFFCCNQMFIIDLDLLELVMKVPILYKSPSLWSCYHIDRTRMFYNRLVF